MSALNVCKGTDFSLYHSERAISAPSKRPETRTLIPRTPALIAANKGLNLPRYASLPGIMKAKKKVIKEVEFASLGLDGAQKVRYTGYTLPPEKPSVKLLAGDASSQVSQLVSCLRDEAKVL